MGLRYLLIVHILLKLVRILALLCNKPWIGAPWHKRNILLYKREDYHASALDVIYILYEDLPLLYALLYCYGIHRAVSHIKETVKAL